MDLAADSDHSVSSLDNGVLDSWWS